MGEVLVGRKPAMSYVLDTVARMASEKEINILARGKNISKAVDVSEILTKRFREDLKLDKIDIGTDKYTDDSGNERKISSIQISLKEG